MSWTSRYDFSEVTDPVRLKNLVECRLRPHGNFTVEMSRFDEDTGAGTLSVEDSRGDFTMIPFHLPEDEERMYRLCRDLLKSDGQWNSPHLAERHERHRKEIGI